ncbi:MAG: DUF433 domain-containing protein [Actinomycetota bacterium]
MPDNELIIRDPQVGRLAYLKGTRISVAEALDALAAGDEWRLIRYQGVSQEALRAAAAYGAELARERVLSPPAAARFVKIMGLEVMSTKPGEARRWTREILERLAGGDFREQILAEIPDLSPELLRAAIAYGAALAGRELLPLPEYPEETVLRDGLCPQELDLVEYFFGAGMTPEEQFTIWKRHVEAVEAGYDDDVWEYTFALGWRDSLEEEFISMLSLPSQDRILPLVRPWDRRYETVTRQSDLPLIDHTAGWAPLRWWWYRVPKILTPRFAKELKENYGIE